MPTFAPSTRQPVQPRTPAVLAGAPKPYTPFQPDELANVKQVYLSNTLTGYPQAGFQIPGTVNGWTNLQWNEVQAEWKIPPGHTYCTGATNSPWIGTGGDSDDYPNVQNLIQGGTNTINAYPTPTTDSGGRIIRRRPMTLRTCQSTKVITWRWTCII